MLNKNSLPPVPIILLCVIGFALFSYSFFEYASGTYWYFIENSPTGKEAFLATAIRFSCRLAYPISFIGLWKMKRWGFYLCLVAWLSQLLPSLIYTLVQKGALSSLSFSFVTLCIYIIIPIIYFKKLSSSGSWKTVVFILLAIFTIHSVSYGSIKLFTKDKVDAKKLAYQKSKNIEREFLSKADEFDKIIQENGTEIAFEKAKEIQSYHLKCSIYLEIAQHIKEKEKYNELLKRTFDDIQKEKNFGLKSSLLVELHKLFAESGNNEKSAKCLNLAYEAIIQLNTIQTNIEYSAILVVARTLAKNNRYREAENVANIFTSAKSRKALLKEIEKARLDSNIN